MRRNRYPGTKPFSTEQEALFYGRKQEVDDLFREIQLNSLTVLHGKSGLGKSSLLNAGLIPRLTGAAFNPLSVRFGARTARSELSPLAMAKAALTAEDPDEQLDRLMPPEENSLWYHLLQYREGVAGSEKPVLLFDQFEELFTYPPEEVEAFAREMAEVLRDRVPDRVERMRQLVSATGLEEAEGTEEKLYRPLDMRVVFSIRSDRIHLLDRLAAYLPDIQRNRYLLQPLSEEGARQAIVLPAGMEGDYDTPSFAYSSDALQKIIGKLADREGRVEGIQLQILCQSFEEKVRQSGGALRKLGAGDLGDLDDLLGNYYQDRIAALGNRQEQQAARKLIEEGLVVESEGARTPMAEGRIREQYGVGPDLLKKLVDSHLLRMEPSRLGEGYTYELSHDTLVEPVLEAKKERKERARRRRLLGVIFLSLALLAGAVGGVLWVRQQWVDAEVAKQDAQQQTLIALEKDSLSRIAAQRADSAAQVALEEKTRADDALEDLEIEQVRTQQALEDAQDARDEAEALRDQAEQALDKLTQEQNRTQEALLEVARLLVQQTEEHIYHLEYVAAEQKMLLIEDAGQLPEFLAEKNFELAFLEGEAGAFQTARNFLRKTLALMDQPLPAGMSSMNDLPSLRDLMREVNPDWYRKYEDRYYPTMIPVEGDTFQMGSENGAEDEQPVHTVQLSDFEMAEKETTIWQFGLYCKATGQDIKDFSPSWGLDGDNPVVNVSWYQAAQYANWISTQFGLDSAYVFDSEGNFEAIRESISAPAFRLPTEAQWEYAARGGTFRSPFRYSGSDEPDEVAWYTDNSELNGVRRTHPVGRKKANALVLYDLSGNVWEWCQDWYGEYPDSVATNPRGPDTGNTRVLRGGSWSNSDFNCRVSIRYRLYPSNGYNYLGFRLTRY